MVSTSDRDHHGSRNAGIRKSIDGYAAAALSSTRKRTSLTLSNWAPLTTPKTAEPHLTLASASDTTSATSSSSSSNSDQRQSHSTAAKHTKSASIMASFFSRFSSRSKPKLTIATTADVEQKQRRCSRHSSSLPSTPSCQTHSKISIPIVDPLPPPNAFRTIEQFPLCVAYVQAIKTSLLPACTLSSEKILRQEAELKAGAEGSKRGRATHHHNHHRHHVSTKSADLDWTKKLFVLVPGILLQYSGEGTDDRLPEKVLQLTERSKAFASDAIPGRPWVLQVCRSASESGAGALVAERRNAFIAKVTFRSGMKNSASAVLLVFECADDMDSWMGVLRSEAARLGGIRPQPPRRRSQERNRQREQAEDEPEKEGSEGSRFARRIRPNREDGNTKNEWSTSSSEENASKRTSTCRTSTDAERSIISHDQAVLDQLRGSRLSLHSGGDKTRIMTVPGTPDTSPERNSPKSENASYKRQSLASTKSQSSVEQRPLPPPPSHISIPPAAPGLSAIDKDGNLYWIPRTPSPPTSTNNFSLPTYRQTRAVSMQAPAVPRSVPSVASTETTQPCRPRPVSIQTVSPYTQMSPKPTPSPRQRPLSMVDSPTRNYYTQQRTPKSSSELLSTPSPCSTPRRVSTLPAPPAPPPASIAVPARSRSLRRRSMGTLESDLARGAPKHPPPSMPLPKVPSPVVEGGVMLGLSQSMPRPGGNWGVVEERRRRRKSSRQTPAQQVGLGISMSMSDEERHSYCSVDEQPAMA